MIRNSHGDIGRIERLLLSATFSNSQPYYPALLEAFSELAAGVPCDPPRNGFLRSHVLHRMETNQYSTEEVLAILALAAPDLVARVHDSTDDDIKSVSYQYQPTLL